MLFFQANSFIKLFSFLLALSLFFSPFRSAQAGYHFADFSGRPPFHSFGAVTNRPSGLTPEQIKRAYNLPLKGGKGTIAIIGAYDNKTIANDLKVFSRAFSLPDCTTTNGCLTIHLMGQTKADPDWATETALDVEWAHAIAPQAKILLVEAKTPSGPNFLAAIDYARKQADVVAVAMSWGGAEFPEETDLDSHFTSANNKITWFASSGDEGSGANWPAASPRVVAVGGTSLVFDSNGKFQTEKAWSGSGGGLSVYEKASAAQLGYSIARSRGYRAIPDVSYQADPGSGFSVYYTAGRLKGWYVIGGTSAGAPQWAAIKALGLSADNDKFYSDKAAANYSQYFRDIKSGGNGDCGYYCAARRHYDYVTGLGSPVTVKF
jgi:subtilase family serine protease